MNKAVKLAVSAAIAAAGVCAFGGERIVFVGDSITGQSRNHSAGFAKQLDAAYAATIAEAADRPTVISLGGSGQTVEGWKSVEKNSRENPQTTLDVAGVYVGENLDQHADRMVVMLGMNNVLSPSTADTPESIAAYKANFHELVTNLVRRATPTVLYLASVPPCTEDPNGPKNAVVQKLNAQIRALVAELPSDPDCLAYVPSLQVNYVPTWENQTNLLAAGRALTPAFHVTGDMVHPNAAGHIRLAQSFLDAFGHDDASAWLVENRLQPELDSAASANTAGLSYTLKATGAGSSAGLYAFTLAVNWVARPNETAPASAAFALTLPDRWQETADAVTDGLSAVFTLEGPAELAATPLRVTATPQTGADRIVTVNVPAPWRVSTPVAVSWANTSGSWKYRADAACETEAAILAGDSFAEIESANATRTPSWQDHFASVDYVGGAVSKSVDFAAMSYYPTFGTAYALRYVYAKRATDATVTLSSSVFSATLDTEVWLNGMSVLAKEGTSGSALVHLNAGNNVLAVRSSHVSWQWQLGVEITAEDNSFALRYGLAPLAAEEESAETEYEPEKPDELDPADYPLQPTVKLLPDGRLVYIYNQPGAGYFLPPAAGTIQVFLVGGGGGGGGCGIPREELPTDTAVYASGGYMTRGGGGGGGGAVVSNDAVMVEKKGYVITVGDGGAQNANGFSSYAFGLQAVGGGAGAWQNAAATAGGPCGGGNYNHLTGASAEGFFSGGTATDPGSNKGFGGGGAGAGGAGGNAASNAAGAGGAGVVCPYLTDETVFGAGGKGGSTGGTDSPLAKSAPDAADGTGQGGQGCNSWYHINAGAGGKGGCGCVIIVCSPGTDYFKEEVKLEATGGVKRVVRDAGRKWITHEFRTNGTFTALQPMCVQAFLVGGGGAGGKANNVRGGGGGAGGVLLVDKLYLLPGDHTIEVGRGGVDFGESGLPSSIDDSFVAFGGGGGGTAWAGAGKAGGSGGGACGPFSNSAAVEEMNVSGGAGTPGQGCAGGNAHWVKANASLALAGGGGGAGGPGVDNNAETNKGYGGDGILCTFLGPDCYYAAGGGSGGMGSSGTPRGGFGGDTMLGGAGGWYDGGAPHPGGDGVDGTGSGGGGEGGTGIQNSGWGKGGSGVVILRYRPVPHGLLLILK